MSHPFSSDSLTNQHVVAIKEPYVTQVALVVNQLEARIAEIESRLAALVEDRNSSRNPGAARNRTPLIKDNASV